MRTLKITLALSLLGSALVATAPVQAQTRQTRPFISSLARYTLPYAVVGCHPSLYDQTTLPNGAVAYSYHCPRIATHAGGNLLYIVVTHNPSYAAARTGSAVFEEGFTKPMVDGMVSTSKVGAIWNIVEVGETEDRMTIGTARHRVVIVVTVGGHPDDDTWAPAYAVDALVALRQRVP